MGTLHISINNKPFLIAFCCFALGNLFFFIFLATQHAHIRFHNENYRVNAHHFYTDPQAVGKPFTLLQALGQYDAQWYLRIAQTGYPKNPTVTNINDKTVMDGLTYAFFPLYPLMIKGLNFFLHNTVFAAFLTSSIFLVLDFVSLYHVIGKLYSTKIALKTISLLFLFPFSIFYRSYFAEGLFLLLLVWFSYFLIKRRMIFAALCLGLLTVTKGNGLLLNVLFLYYLGRAYQQHKVTRIAALLCLLLISLPVLGWITFCYYQTGHPLYFYHVLNAWHPGWTTPFDFLRVNLQSIVLFPYLPFHSFHFSQVDIVILFATGIILGFSKQVLKPELWWISFILAATPLITHDLMSYSRYQSVSFPLFIYLAIKFSGWKYGLIAIGFGMLLFVTGLYFVNWYWVG